MQKIALCVVAFFVQFGCSTPPIDSARVNVGVAAQPVFTLQISVDEPVLAVDASAHPGSTKLRIFMRDADGLPSPGTFSLETDAPRGKSIEALETDADGVFVRVVTAGSLPGIIRLRAVKAEAQARASMRVSPGQLNHLAYLSATTKEISAPEYGNWSHAVLSFAARDVYGNAITDTPTIDFSLSPALYGTSLTPVTGQVQAGGVTVAVVAGEVSGIGTVRAVRGEIAAESQGIAVRRPVSAQRISLSFTPNVVSGFSPGVRNAELTVLLGDRYGNPPSLATEVFFACESGNCGAGKGHRPTIDGSLARPFTTVVSSFPYEHGEGSKVEFPGIGTAHAWPALGNPSNGYVTLLAYTLGESDYTDVNGNARFDLGIDIVTADPPEPYVDSNDNASWDADEWFVDWDGDGFSTHAHSVYHARQLVSATGTLLYADEPAVQMVPAQFIDMNGDGLFDPADDRLAVGGPVPTAFPYASPATLVVMASYATGPVGVFVNFSDKNANPLPEGTVMIGSLEAAPAGITLVSPPLSARTYQAGYVFPKPLVHFQINDEAPLAYDGNEFLFCASVEVADTLLITETCIGGYRF